MLEDSIFKLFADELPLPVHIWSMKHLNNVGKNTILYVNKEANQAHCSNIRAEVGDKVGKAFPKLDTSVMPLAFQIAAKNNHSQRVLQFVCGPEKKLENTYRVEMIPIIGKYMFLAFTSIHAQLLAESELAENMKEIKKMNRYMLDRETKMIELKNEIDSLKKSSL